MSTAITLVIEVIEVILITLVIEVIEVILITLVIEVIEVISLLSHRLSNEGGLNLPCLVE